MPKIPFIIPGIVGGVSEPSEVPKPQLKVPAFKKGITSPHFSSVLTITEHGSLVVEQNSEGDLEARVFNVAACPEGFREDAPDFGISELLFQRLPLDLESMAHQIARLAEVEITLSETGGSAPAYRQILAEVSGSTT